MQRRVFALAPKSRWSLGKPYATAATAVPNPSPSHSKIEPEPRKTPEGYRRNHEKTGGFGGTWADCSRHADESSIEPTANITTDRDGKFSVAGHSISMYGTMTKGRRNQKADRGQQHLPRGFGNEEERPALTEGHKNTNIKWY